MRPRLLNESDGMRGGHSSSARQQAAIAISKKKTASAAAKRGSQKFRAAKSSGRLSGKAGRGRFPGDVNRDGRINAADFRAARALGKGRA